MRVTVTLEVTLEDVPERELGVMDVNTVGGTLVDYVEDYMGDRTRKEFDEPWRVVSVKLAK